MRTYIPNPKFAAEYAASTDALAMVEALATEAAPLARDLAATDTGDLAESVEASAAVVDGIATGRVSAGNFKAGWLEFGTRRSDSGGRAQPFLRPAVSAVTGRPIEGGLR